MKNFSEIDESMLSKTDSKVSNAKGTAKELVMSDFIHGILPQLNKTYLGFGSRWEFGSDAWGTPIRLGDLVVFQEDTHGQWDAVIGVVASLADKNGCHVVVTGKSSKSGGNPDDPYDDCIQYLIPGTSMFVLAHEGDTKRMLNMIIKLLK